MMKVLIIGSEGFIGNSCISYFISKNVEVYGCDLLDLKSPSYHYFKISRFSPGFDRIFQENNFDVCINAAGSGSVPLSITHPYRDFEANSIDTFNVLEAIRLFNPKSKFINLSSAAVYGNPKYLPIAETHDVHPLSPYGWHKYYSELICKEYSILYQIDACSIRPFSVYGPGLKKQLFWDLYQKTLQSDDVVLFGTGFESRDFIYITDLVRCIDLIIEKGDLRGEVYNAASGKEVSIKEVSTIFLSNLVPENRISFNGESRPGDPLNWRADISKLHNLGFTTEVGISEGIFNYTEWLKERK